MTETLPRRQDPPRQPPRGPRLPEIPGPLETAWMLWRRLRRMSTALMLLFALAAASMIATLIPQEPVVATTVSEWRAGEAGPGAEVSAVLDGLGFFDVFGSWWFAALTVLLFVSLTGCLIPRFGAFARTVRRPPVAGRDLERLSNHRVLSTTMDAAAALDAVEARMKRRRFRRRRVQGGAGAQLATERGHWREGGSLVFHTSFYVLLVGIAIGQAFGFTGQLNIREGGTFTETRISYGAAEPGRWFSLEDHRGFQVRLDDFDASYHENFVPRDFVSTVTILEDGREVVSGAEIRVNQPLHHNGMNVYQMRFGMAPRVIVRAGDRVLFDEQVMLSQADGEIWTGAAKISVADPQIALDLALVPDLEVTRDADGNPQIFNRSPAADNPELFADLWVGDLGLERPVAATMFDRDGGDRLASAQLGEGESAQLLGEQLTVEFAELTHWSGFQVSHQPGRWILLLAAGLVLLGLIPSLYSYRRRIWAETRQTEQGAAIVLAGVSLQRKQRFADEFAEIAKDVEDALNPRERRVDG